MTARERIAVLARKYARVEDGPYGISYEYGAEELLKATIDYLEEQRARQALCSAYCAHVMASCGYPGYVMPQADAEHSYKAALSIGERLGLPEDVMPKMGEAPNVILRRFAEWLEGSAK